MIDGLRAPKFVVDGTDLLLDHFIVQKDEPVYDNLIRKSIINGATKIKVKGYHWAFEGETQLWRYAKDNPPVDPAAKYLELYSNLYKSGSLYRHRDHDPIKSDAGVIVSFILIEIIPYCKFSNGYNFNYDAAIVKFISSAYVDITKSVHATIIDDKGNAIQDDTGKTLDVY